MKLQDFLTQIWTYHASWRLAWWNDGTSWFAQGIKDRERQHGQPTRPNTCKPGLTVSTVMRRVRATGSIIHTECNSIGMDWRGKRGSLIPHTVIFVTELDHRRAHIHAAPYFLLYMSCCALLKSIHVAVSTQPRPGLLVHSGMLLWSSGDVPLIDPYHGY